MACSTGGDPWGAHGIITELAGREGEHAIIRKMRVFGSVYGPKEDVEAGDAEKDALRKMQHLPNTACG